MGVKTLSILDMEEIIKHAKSAKTDLREGKKYAVIYARYSSDKQNEMSIEGQLRDCMEYAKKHGYIVIGKYIDRKLTAKTDRRPKFLQMISDSANRQFDIVLVWKLDRFARNRAQSAKYKELLKAHGVDVVSATENISQDSSGMLLEGFLEVINEWYSVDLAEKVTRGMTENALRCKSNGNNVPIGYKTTDDLHIVPDMNIAPIISDAFKMYADGASMTDVMNFLNNNGVRNRRGKKINHNAANRMLKTKMYMGDYTFGEMVIPDGVEAIISRELFEQVQEIMERNKRAPARFKAQEGVFLLSGKIFCGRCGSSLVGDSTVNRHGTPYFYYKCLKAKKGRTCFLRAVRVEKMDDVVIDYIKSDILIDSFLEKIADALCEYQDTTNARVPMIKRTMREVEKKIHNILKAIEAGIISETTSARLQELEAEKKDLEIQLLDEEIKHPKYQREDIVKYLHRFRSLKLETSVQKQTLINSFINSVYLFDNEITINYNYHKRARIVPLADIASSTPPPDESEGSEGGEAMIRSEDSSFFLKGSDMNLFGPPFSHEIARRFHGLFS